MLRPAGIVVAIGLVAFVGAASAAQHAVTPIGTKIVVGANPSALAIAPDGQTVYVTAAQINSRRGTLAFVDAGKKQVTRRIRVGQNPEAITLSLSGGRAFVANYGSNTVSVVSTRTGAILRTLKTGLHPASLLDTIVGARELLFIANGGPVQPAKGSLQVVAVDGYRAVKTIQLPFNPTSLVASPDGRTVYVGNANAPSVSVVDTRTMKVTRNVRLTRAGPVNAVALDSNGGLLYAATIASTVVLSTRTFRALAVIPADDPGDPLGIDVGPEGPALVVNGQGDAPRPEPGTLTVIRGTKRVRTVGPLGYFAGDVAIAPDGQSTWVTSFGLGDNGYVLTFPTPAVN